jgi:hypothetical protein
MALHTIPKQEGGKLKAVASGALPSGVPVIVNSDGTVSAVGGGNLTSENYIGMSTGVVADGASATVDIVGAVSSNQVDLTPGQRYYVQTDGTVDTTPASPSVLAGTAVSATKMVVKS